MLNSISQADTGPSKAKPSRVDCEDALNDCKRAIGMLYCIIGATSVDMHDKEDALGFVTNNLGERLHTLRAYFEMDKEEAAS